MCDVNEIEDTSEKQSHESVEKECVNLMLVPGFGLIQLLDGKVVQSHSDTRAAVRCNLQKEAATNSAKRLPS